MDRSLTLFPFLQNVDKMHHEYLTDVAETISRLGEYNYNSKYKYEYMWNVVRLGCLLDIIVPNEIKEGVTLKTLTADAKEKKMCADLTKQQQWALFKTTKNICSDFFHLMYEEATKKFLEQVILLCQGENICESLALLSQQYTKLSRGRDLEKLLKNDGVMQTKIFNQTGYFLIRANDFFKIDNIPSANMALLGACNCARFVFISKIKNDQNLEGMAKLFEMRKLLSHVDLSDAQEDKRVEIIRETCSNLENNLVQLNKDARILGLEADAHAYSKAEKPAEDNESPRGLPKL